MRRDIEGERRSVNRPVRIRAMVEVRATMEMCVAADPAAEGDDGDEREGSMVPSFEDFSDVEINR